MDITHAGLRMNVCARGKAKALGQPFGPLVRLGRQQAVRALDMIFIWTETEIKSFILNRGRCVGRVHKLVNEPTKACNSIASI